MKLAMPTKRQQGFTLMELMITLAIAAILLMVAAPSFRDFIKSNAVQADTRVLLDAITYARTEAVSRNAFITVCASANGTSCSASADWSSGWIIFVDNGAGGSATDVANISWGNSEPILRVNQKQSATTIIAADNSGNGVQGLMFSSRGYMEGLKRSTATTTADTVSMVVCEPDGALSFARAIFVDISGRARSSLDKNNNGVHDNITGGDLSCSS